jgi:hypothetical protein
MHVCIPKYNHVVIRNRTPANEGLSPQGLIDFMVENISSLSYHDKLGLLVLPNVGTNTHIKNILGSVVEKTHCSIKNYELSH